MKLRKVDEDVEEEHDKHHDYDDDGDHGEDDEGAAELLLGHHGEGAGQ